MKKKTLSTSLSLVTAAVVLSAPTTAVFAENAEAQKVSASQEMNGMDILRLQK